MLPGAVMPTTGELLPQVGTWKVAKRVGKTAPVASATRAATW